MKKCFKCDTVKPLTEFYRHPQMSDNHLNKCKECNKLDSRKQYHRKTEDLSWRLSERNRSKEKYKRLYANKKPNKTSQWEKERHAKSLVGSAVKCGRLFKPSKCTFGFDDCFGRIEAHHYDYDRPLDVLWLCTSCHRYIHKKALL